MTRDEIYRYICVGSSKSVCVDIRLIPEYPGFVRSIIFREGNRVSVEFETYGSDEGGAYFNAEYRSLDAAIDAVEEFLGSPIESWQNYNKTGNYPEPPYDLNASDDGEKLREAIRNDNVPLPKGSRFSIPSGYWNERD
jgi:hypothetical protein